MKIVDRKTFLSMPPGTVFSTYKPTIFGPIWIKGDSLKNDFFFVSPDDALDEKSRELLEDGVEDQTLIYDLDTEEREGLYDDNQRYAVWDTGDVQKLISKLQEAVSENT